MDKSIRTERKTTDYGGLSAINHVYKIPDTYCGNCKPQTFDAMILEDKKITNKKLKIPQGVQRVFLEILSNAGDNVDASRRAGVNPDCIKIKADEKTISIENGGLHIPVKKVSLLRKNGNTTVGEYKEGDEVWKWLPAFIFGEFRSSNNYDEKHTRMGCGRNGFGAKLTNIFSKTFIVEVEDPDTKIKFKGIWRNNMFKDDENGKPEIEIEEDKNIKKGKVKITWDLDFERFKMEKYCEDDLNLFKRFAVDFSFTCKIKTFFNEEEIDYRNIKDYASLIWSEEEIKNHIISYVWNKDAPESLKSGSQKMQEGKIIDAKKPEHIPDVEILIIDTVDKGKNISYVNGLITEEGGVHLDAAQEPVFKHIANIINGEKKRGKKAGSSITVKNIRSHVSFIVNARLPDPEYTSQSKTRLASPSIEVSYEDKVFKNIQNWEVISRLHAELEAMAYNKASKNDGSKRKHISMDKGEDANLAGTKHSQQCKLYLVEGLSAANYPQKRICMLEGGKDYNGYMPLKGKFLNITKAKPTQYAENTVVASIKQIMGLREEVDYSDYENIKTLRYGFIILTVDADDDGMHILAHVLNFFREKFPGILQRNMIGYLRTPVIKLLKGDKIHKRFFTVPEFEKWSIENNTRGLTVRYYKGLGTSNDDDIKDDLKTAPTVVCFYDSSCQENLDLAFHEDNADRRKAWIEKWRDVTQCEDVVSVDISSIRKGDDKLMQGQDISQFINRELIGYSVASLFRAIPSEFDHLKDSQRKCLYSALTFFNYDPKKGKSIKVGRFANKAADMTQYHHGEKSLIDTFIKMAQDFVGSNNMGYFKKDGQFGTRADGGENAADARYSETHLAWWIPLVYQKESIELVKKRTTDEEECEPLWLPGVIPMGIINGTNGIATAFSTSTPCHNPIDVIDWYVEKCQGKTPKPITPWYNDFTGRMQIINRDQKEDIKIETGDSDEDELLPGDIDSDRPVTSPKRFKDLTDEEIEGFDEESLAIIKHQQNSKLTLKTYGKYDIIGVHKNGGPIVQVTEVPVKLWIHRYRKWLESLIQSKSKNKAIYDYKDNSTTEKAKFIIHWNNHYKSLNHQNLRLIRSCGISNITLIDHEGFPSQFTSIQKVMEKYYLHMLEHYKSLIKRRTDIEKEKTIDITYRMKFIIHVLREDIKIIKIKEDIIESKMKELEIPFEYYEKSKGRDFSLESVDKYKKLLEESKTKLKAAENLKPEDVWIEKLQILRKELKKRFKKGILYMKK